MSLDVEIIGGNGAYYEANVTHNLNKMAMEAGIYEYLWRPDEIGITKAGRLIEPLSKGLTDWRYVQTITSSLIVLTDGAI